MPPYKLWALSEPGGQDLLLITQQEDDALGDPTYAADEAAIRQYLSARGMPAQIVANLWVSVSRLRQADDRLFHVPATVLKPKDLVGPLVAVLLRTHRT